MSFDGNLKSMLSKEGINIKEFAALSGISYMTARRYVSGERTPTVEVINNKILAVPQLEKYRSLLLGTEEPIQTKLDPNNPRHQRFQLVLDRICERGLEDEAFAILEALGAPTRKELQNPDR